MSISTSNLNAHSQKMNEIINNLQSMSLCDKDCQREKKIERLKTEYLNAKNNKKNAGSIVEEAERKYYIAKEGKSGYNDIMLDKYKQEAKKLKNISIKEHNKNIDKLENSIKNYNNDKKTLESLRELLKVRTNELENLESKVDNEIKSVYTNNRRVFYEESELKSLNYYKSILIIIYFIVFIVYIILSKFFQNKKYTKVFEILKLVCLLVFPFLLYYIVYVFYQIISLFMFFFGKLIRYNVYSNLKNF